MAVATLPAFTLDGAAGHSFAGTSTRYALPGSSLVTDAIVVLTNVGTLPVWVALGGSTVTVAVGAGSLVMPGQARVLALGSNTYIAGIVQGASTYYSGANGILHVETGN